MFDSPEDSNTQTSRSELAELESSEADSLSADKVPRPVSSANPAGGESPGMFPVNRYRLPDPARSTFRPAPRS
jgi:hypothetical protein